MIWRDGYGWMGGWMAPLMGVSAVLWWVLVIAIVLAVLRWSRTPQAGGRDVAGGPAVSRGPRQVLDLRFARGEIDADEYAERRRLMASETAER